ncbi:MAG TPA: tRNA (guanosine(37)-N1)-methyltransferase TrmD [Thermoanaerobaculia bacterium]|nr:tRNA (guanosine(37)-N1)-methyltransferase TrmD [Thermoanaerobaculia bacterium]
MAAETEIESAVLRIDVVTIFPTMFAPFLQEGVLARAVKRGLLDVRVWDLRDFAKDKHRSTDDEAYGGGAGMVMLAEPVFTCVEQLRLDGGPAHVMMTSPQGKRFDQEKARDLAGRRRLIILCGRYEGFDERIRIGLVDEEISLGDFVVSGGEVPAMLVIDAVTRMIEGVVGKQESVIADSFYAGLLDHPHYTRPASFRGMDVPAVLLSGHAERIRKWRKEEILRATLTKRPDLLEKAELDEEARKMLARLGEEIKDRSSL